MRRRLLSVLLPLAAWVALLGWLTVADVWDESLGLSMFYDGAPVSWDDFTVRSSRPGAVLLLARVFSLVREPELAWRVARVVNLAFVAGSFVLMLATLARLRPETTRQPVLLALTFLFSASAIITGSWYANLYDAAVLLLLWTGIYLLAATRFAILPGVAMGLAFFCKEVAVLIVPFAVALAWNRTLDRRRTLIAVGVALPFLAAYAVFRERTIPLGGPGDIHSFDPAWLAPSMLGWLSSFWWQSMRWPGQWIAGLAVLGLSLAALRSRRLLLGVAAVLVAAGLMYWGMFVHYSSALLAHQHFVGRLYLVPASFFLFALALDGRRWGLAVVAVPLLIGGIETAVAHRRFQTSFRELYALSSARTPDGGPLRVQCSAFPGTFHSLRRNLIIGRVPDAHYRLNQRTGALMPTEAGGPP